MSSEYTVEQALQWVGSHQSANAARAHGVLSTELFTLGTQLDAAVTNERRAMQRMRVVEAALTEAKALLDLKARVLHDEHRIADTRSLGPHPPRDKDDNRPSPMATSADGKIFQVVDGKFKEVGPVRVKDDSLDRVHEAVSGLRLDNHTHDTLEALLIDIEVLGPKDAGAYTNAETLAQFLVAVCRKIGVTTNG